MKTGGVAAEVDRVDARTRALATALDSGVLHPEEAPLAAFVDLDGVEENVARLHRAFRAVLPASASILHAFAVKAHSEIPMLRSLGAFGMGCEVASEGELAQALAAGIAPSSIVFDSPAKSRRELARAFELGVAVNADNFQELGRIDALVGEADPAAGLPRSTIGVRINPQSGVGAIAAMSTAGIHSKFGIPLRDDGARERLLEAVLTRPWITRLHAHVGSQGVGVPLVAEGLRAVVELADEVNARAGYQQISSIDIGGGLAVDFSADDPYTDWDAYAAALGERVPRLFSGDFDLVTEFGRAVLAKFGFIAAHVEYTKCAGGRAIAITHAGAQVATRTAFMPESWPIRVEGRDAAGRIKPGEAVSTDVAGPCCFAGDLVAVDRRLPPLEPGDLVTLLDTGAYYASTGFRYNSLLEPGIYGVRRNRDETEISTIRAPESLDALLRREPSATVIS